MPNICKPCHHPQRQEFEALIIEGRSINSVAQKYGITVSSLWHHVKVHMSTDLNKAQEAKKLDLASKNLNHLLKMIKITDRIVKDLNNSKGSKDYEMLLYSIDRAVKQIEVMHKLTEKAAQQAVNINIVALPEWHSLKSGILRVLEAYPEALQAVTDWIEDQRSAVIDVKAEPRALPKPQIDPFATAISVAEKEMAKINSIEHNSDNGSC